MQKASIVFACVSSLMFCGVSPRGNLILLLCVFNRKKFVGFILLKVGFCSRVSSTSLCFKRVFMGTAVLFPQDCLRPRSRLKNQNQVMICALDSAPRSKSSSQSSRSGLLPLPTHAQHSFPVGAPSKGNDVKHSKTTKATDVRDCSSLPTSAPSLPVYRILKRPKQGGSMTELPAHFARLDKSGVLEEVRGSQGKAPDNVDRYPDIEVAQNGSLGSEVSALKMKCEGLHVRVGELSGAGGCARPRPAIYRTKDSSRFANGSCVSNVEEFKHMTVKVVHSRVKNVVKEKLSSDFAVVKPTTAKAAGKNDTPTVGHHGEVQDNVLPKSLAPLRRTTTEPPMAKHTVGQYTSRVMHISFNDLKLEAHAQEHQYCGVDLSCEERWAGPAYSASPPPSSLPLPKLCLPHAKVTSSELPPLIQQYSTSVYTQSFLEPSGPTCRASGNGEAWDAAFATKSLRRLLNLDSC